MRPLRSSSVLIDRIGADNAARLAAIVGGTRLHVPGDPRNAGRLKRLVGDDLAIVLLFHFADSRFYVPTLSRSPRVDPRKIKRLAAKGWSSARIARHLKCSERTVDAKRAAMRAKTAKP